MSEVLELVKKVEAHSRERHGQQAPQRMALGTDGVFRQGDIYIQRLRSKPVGCRKIEAHAQIAPGETQGSRHILDSLDGVAMYVRVGDEFSPLDGPVLVLAKERTLTHPEHGHVILEAGVYSTTYQRQYAEELRRVAD